MPLNMSFIIQFSRSTPRKSRFQRTRNNLKSLCDFLCRRRTIQNISRPIIEDPQSGFADDDSSWLGPPPGYEEEEDTRSHQDSPHERGSEDSGNTVFEGVAALTSATITGPMDLPASTPSGTSSTCIKIFSTNDIG